jgi:hypothetical protein
MALTAARAGRFSAGIPRAQGDLWAETPFWSRRDSSSIRADGAVPRPWGSWLTASTLEAKGGGRIDPWDGDSQEGTVQPVAKPCFGNIIVPLQYALVP